MRNRKAFTLIELLVVIAVIALLLGILVPTLQRVRRQARAVVCQAHLRQWGSLWATVASENDGRFPRWEPDNIQPNSAHLGPACGWGWGRFWWDEPWGQEDWETIKRIRCCPMVARPANPTGTGHPDGGTFLAWGRWVTEERWLEKGHLKPWELSYGSYAVNPYGFAAFADPPGRDSTERLWWGTHRVKNRNNIPVCLDGAWPSTGVWRDDISPPSRDAVPTGDHRRPYYKRDSCINRHNGGVNCLFLDWSVRKVGLKELWTLKWHRKFDTANAWTKAGGVKPEDWPQWMRGFKDY